MNFNAVNAIDMSLTAPIEQSEKQQIIQINPKQQAVAVQQVVAAMNEINLGAKETASGITQVKVSTEQLKDAAHKLKAVV